MALEDKTQMHLRLYVADDSLPSLQAKANLKAICREHLPDTTVSIEVVDILIDPIRCLNEGILVTPTLVKLSPPPVRKVLGTLSDTQTVLDALGLGG